ncbi:MAG: hypothetical protein EA369_01450, partial [Bradymonadales bacterium]
VWFRCHSRSAATQPPKQMSLWRFLGTGDKGPDARRQGESIAVWFRCHSRSAATQPPKQMGL